MSRGTKAFRTSRRRDVTRIDFHGPNLFAHPSVASLHVTRKIFRDYVLFLLSSYSLFSLR